MCTKKKGISYDAHITTCPSGIKRAGAPGVGLSSAIAQMPQRPASGRWGIGALLLMLAAAAVVVVRELAVPRRASSFELLAGSEWGWLNAAPPLKDSDTVAPAPMPAPARSKDLHEDSPLPITGDPYLTQVGVQGSGGRGVFRALPVSVERVHDSCMHIHPHTCAHIHIHPYTYTYPYEHGIHVCS
jgi:hypothetical protein